VGGQAQLASERQSWPGASRSGDDPLYRRLPHLVVIAIAISMVLGSGFWSREQDQPSVSPGGTDNIQRTLSSTDAAPIAAQEPTQSTEGLIASTAENLMGGYLSTSSLSVTPQQLGITTYVTRQGQSISSVAVDTGLSEETLLWANDYRDPSQSLPAGTQLRVPPTDGMLHLVSDGDTLDNIADRYDVLPDVITSYDANGVEHSADLVPNRMIMVPGGSMPMRNEVLFYTVREGDQLYQIADRFGLRDQTILWTNKLTSSDMITPGQQLAILPTDGVMVEVTAEDTVETLAEEYGVDPSAIRDWPANGLGADGSLVSGESIMIPGGTPPPEPEPTPTPEPEPTPEEEDEEETLQLAEADEESEDDDGEEESEDVFAEPVGGSRPDPTEPSGASPHGTGEFVWPTTGVITQYFHSSHNGWDIANRPGTEIWAADNGRVVFSGWNNHGLGYAVAIDHGNGYETWYGHMEEHPPVEVGQAVGQGEYIGPMGNTGFSTGPHVHFVIAYNGQYQDPGSYLE
jgi:murein DD-endopeptidase MepM/ murein hydrolase activator NlpD